MRLTNQTIGPLRVFCDELGRLGVQHAVTCPGSRNAPLIYALAETDGITTWPVVDERSAGFFALGIAKATGKPVAITCTSGTAAANLMPAVVEASSAGLPLIVLTADRPPELRAVGAPQSIDQIKLFGGFVNEFVEVGNHDFTEDTLAHYRALACRAVDRSLAPSPGAVHFNFGLREPLDPVDQPLPTLLGETVHGRSDRRPWTAPSRGLLASADGELLGLAQSHHRGIIVCGEQHNPDLPAAVAAFSRATGFPVLADPLSQVRCGRDCGSHVIAGYDAFLRDQRTSDALEPDLIIQIGALPTSKSLRTLITGADCYHVIVGPTVDWKDSSRIANQFLQTDPTVTLLRAAESFAASGVDPATDWSTVWADVELATQTALDASMVTSPKGIDSAFYRVLTATIPDQASIWMSSSMPVRDCETLIPSGPLNLRFLANRGANGIDGVISSAAGAAASSKTDNSRPDPVFLVIGDLALLHDCNALGLIGRYDLDLTIICVDNDGGGIFSFLPISGHPPHFETHIATPSAVPVEGLSAAFGLRYRAVKSVRAAELADAIADAQVVHIRTERPNSETRAPIWAAVSAATRAIVDAKSDTGLDGEKRS